MHSRWTKKKRVPAEIAVEDWSWYLQIAACPACLALTYIQYPHRPRASKTYQALNTFSIARWIKVHVWSSARSAQSHIAGPNHRAIRARRANLRLKKSHHAPCSGLWSHIACRSAQHAVCSCTPFREEGFYAKYVLHRLPSINPSSIHYFLHILHVHVLRRHKFKKKKNKK